MSEASKPDTIDHIRGFAAYVLHPPNGYLQPICTLVLALAVMSVGGSIARDAQNKEMCARYWAYSQLEPRSLWRAQTKKLAARLGLAESDYVYIEVFCRRYE